MADLPDDTDLVADSGVGRDRRPSAGTPRWVKVFGIVTLVVLLLFVVILIFGPGGGHGPRRHGSGGGSNSDAPAEHTGPPPGITHGDQQP